jgi:hypothetical protein
MTNEAACDIEECPDCDGCGDVVGCVVCEDALPAEDSDRCARCAGDRDDEPFDIDGDAGFDPYTGGPESPYECDDAGDWYGDE